MIKGCFKFIGVVFLVVVGAILVLVAIHWFRFRHNSNQGQGIVLHNLDDRLPPEDAEPPDLNLPNLETADASERIEFSHSRGYYREGFGLRLTARNSEDLIYYTLDGSFPFPQYNPRALSYSGSFPIAESTVVRAVAIHPVDGASAIQTHTYLFLKDILEQSKQTAVKRGWPSGQPNGQRFDYGMDPDIVESFSESQWQEAFEQIPTVSLVTAQEFLTDPQVGIFSNAFRRGRGWERPGSVEWVDPLGGEGFQSNAGVRIRGGFTRQPYFYKHAFRLFFRTEYGDGKLNHPLFGDEGANEFDKMDLRSSQNYSWARRGDYNYGRFNTLIRDVFCRDLQGAMGLPYTRSRYYHLFLNGHYWGIFMTEERPEAAFGATYFGGDREDFDTVKSANFGFGHVTEATDGDLQAWRQLWELARKVPDDRTHAAYFQLQGLNPEGDPDPSLPVLLDVDNLIQYMLIIFYSGNSDSPLSAFMQNGRANNWFAIRNRKSRDGFRFLIHDAEHTLGTPDSGNDRTGPFHHRNQNDFRYSNPQWVHQDLMANSEYRIRFADMTHRHFFDGGVLTYPKAKALMETRVRQIDRAIRAQSARWGDAVRRTPYTVDDWREQVDWLMNSYLVQRADIVLVQLMQDQLYPSMSAPGFSHPGGRVPSGMTLTIGFNSESAADEASVYYTLDGSDPRQIGGTIAPTAIRLSRDEPIIILNESTRILARTMRQTSQREGARWSALKEAWFTVGNEPTGNELVLTKISYRPENETEEETALGFTSRSEFEFLEFTNISQREVPLDGLRFELGIDFDFKKQSLVKRLLPGESVFIVKNKDAFIRRFGTGSLIAGEFQNGTQLDNGGERLLIRDSEDNILVDVTYDNQSPWPESSSHSIIALEIPKEGTAIQYAPENWKGVSGDELGGEQ